MRLGAPSVDSGHPRWDAGGIEASFRSVNLTRVGTRDLGLHPHPGHKNLKEPETAAGARCVDSPYRIRHLKRTELNAPEVKQQREHDELAPHTGSCI